MARKLLINAKDPEDCRVAIISGDRLVELDVERADQTQLKGNIYKAPISRIEPSLQAAFLDIGSERNGFLQINDLHSGYFQNWPPENFEGRLPRPAIQDVLDPHVPLIVQVVKDERDAKGATLTTNLSIPGRYLVLMVGNQRGGVSRKINDAAQRKRLRQAVHSLRVPPGMGVIVRTAGISRSTQELQKDLDNLLETWTNIVVKSLSPEPKAILYKESDLATRAIRDYLTSDIEEILIDDRTTYERAEAFVSRVMPTFLSRVKFYQDTQPLFSKFLLDSQIETISQPEVVLLSGGSIVINVTEAVVAVDVNSGRSTSQSDVEETAFATNKEAAEEIARQLRLRDLGGLVVIDFIDMADRRHKQIVEKTMKDAVRTDKAKVETGRISKFGLMEMSRQRLKSSLTSQSQTVCPHCSGRGRIKTPEVTALEALRKIQSSVYSGGISGIRARLAPNAALYLLNNKRAVLCDIEKECHVEILVYADGRIKADQYELELIANRKDAILHDGAHRGFSKDNGARSADVIKGQDYRDNNRNNKRGKNNRRDNSKKWNQSNNNSKFKGNKTQQYRKPIEELPNADNSHNESNHNADSRRKDSRGDAPVVAPSESSNNSSE